MHERWAEQPETDLVPALQDWWRPLLAACPTVREGIGAACLLRAVSSGHRPDPVEVLIDFPAGDVRAYAGEPYGFRFDIDRPLVEKVVAERAVDWSNSLFLSCRFRAWRRGEFNEYVYNFFKSLSPGRMRRTEAEAMRKLHPPTETEPDIELDGWVMQRRCPHRNADLSVFGEVHGCELVCTLHGWRFDLETGRCLTSAGHELPRAPPGRRGRLTQVTRKAGREQCRHGRGRVEVGHRVHQLVAQQAVDQAEQVVDVPTRRRRSEPGEQRRHPRGDLLLGSGDLGAQDRLVRRFDEDGTPRLAEHAASIDELVEKPADDLGQRVHTIGTKVDGEPRPHRRLALEDAPQDAGQQRLAGAEAVRCRLCTRRRHRPCRTTSPSEPSPRRRSRCWRSGRFAARARSGPPASSLTAGVNELPFVFLALVVVSTEPILSAGDVTPMGWLAVALALLTVSGLGTVVAAALRAGRRLEAALGEALGPNWRDEIDPDLGRQLRHRLPWLQILLTPWTIWRREVERVTDVAYAADGRSNLLDVYRHRSRPTSAPTLIYLHGGRFRWGRKSREGRPLLFRLASQGWTCISANYHLSPTPAEGFPRHLVDVKKVIAWARTDGRRFGVDPDCIVLAGSSAGAHLTMMAALSANDPTFQPGFESVDTSVIAGIGLGGYYGPLGGDERPPSSPSAYLRPDAPALMLIHGDHDTCTPPEGARRLVAGLRATSANTVVYAELPGAQHAFDLFQSIRFNAVVDAVEAFAAWVRSPRHDRPAARSIGSVGAVHPDRDVDRHDVRIPDVVHRRDRHAHATV